ncbi:MAG: YdcF family protein [Armatimonadota bacterium]|nr:YdcF family protein [Armatimonadota bacterium]
MRRAWIPPLVGLGLVLTLAAWALSTPFGLQAAGDFLVIRDPLRPADVVIAISGDGTGERARTAAVLLRRGFAPWMIVSGSRAGAARGGAAAEMARVAVQAGAPQDRVVLDDQSTSTQDNARHSARLMERHGWKRAILVTSPYHTRRAAVIFRAEFRPRGLALQVYAADGSFFDVRGWWTRDQDRALVRGEYMKMAAWLLGIR